MLLNCGIGEDSESPLDCKEIQPAHPKGDQSWVFIGRTDAEAETPVLWPPDEKSWFIWKDPDAGKDWGQEEKGMTEDEMVGWHHRLDGHGFGSTLGVGDGQGGLTCYSSWGLKELDTTERLNWTELKSEFSDKGFFPFNFLSSENVELFSLKPVRRLLHKTTADHCLLLFSWSSAWQRAGTLKYLLEIERKAEDTWDYSIQRLATPSVDAWGWSCPCDFPGNNFTLKLVAFLFKDKLKKRNGCNWECGTRNLSLFWPHSNHMSLVTD